jgi:hypothetical protein
MTSPSCQEVEGGTEEGRGMEGGRSTLAATHMHEHCSSCRHCFFVPGVAQKWRWGFYSCNGFHDPAHEAECGGIQPLWRDVLQCHKERPVHVMVGGGDQLYSDDVWSLPSLAQVRRGPS